MIILGTSSRSRYRGYVPLDDVCPTDAIYVIRATSMATSCTNVKIFVVLFGLQLLTIACVRAENRRISSEFAVIYDESNFCICCAWRYGCGEGRGVYGKTISQAFQYQSSTTCRQTFPQRSLGQPRRMVLVKDSSSLMYRGRVPWAERRLHARRTPRGCN
jgi:hypothetical protein